MPPLIVTNQSTGTGLTLACRADATNQASQLGGLQCCGSSNNSEQQQQTAEASSNSND